MDSIGGDAREKLPKGDTPDIDLTSETPEEDEVEAEILGDDEDAEEAKVNRKVRRCVNVGRELMPGGRFGDLQC